MLPSIALYEAPDGRRLAVRVWSAAQSPRGQFVFLHGVTSHSGWYHGSCTYLAERGFDVHFLDRRGSGLNNAQAGDVPTWQTWIDDVAAYLAQIRGERPTLLAGISWGGKLAAAVARRQPGLVGGLALICPGLYSPHEPGLLKCAVLFAPMPKRLRDSHVKIPLRDPALFTDQPLWRDFIARDPLTLRQVTWRFAREDRHLTRYARQAAPYLHMPLLLMLAGRDRIVDNRRTATFFHRAGSSKRILIEYPNAAHTLEFEPDPKPYFDDLAEWGGRFSTSASGCHT
jgi:alpha-beta hydrolase superfamily lysophospholipase